MITIILKGNQSILAAISLGMTYLAAIFAVTLIELVNVRCVLYALSLSALLRLLCNDRKHHSLVGKFNRYSTI